ncbi:MAG TPA: hypothetical protein VG276_26930 [Actinomycetes bacterium]|nr:hypothetical protein [Actinomycetes bacterium]
MDSIVIALVVAGHLDRRPAEAALDREHGVDRGVLDPLRLPGPPGRIGDAPPQPRQQASGQDERATGDDGREGGELAFGVQLVEPALEPGLQLVGPLARLGRVHAALRQPARQLLVLELVGSVVPVADLGEQPFPHGGGGPLHPVEGPAPDLLQVVTGLGHAVVEASRLQVVTHPPAIEDRPGHLQLLGRGRPAVEIGRPAGAARAAVLVDLDELEALGHDPPVAAPVEAPVLDGVLQVDEHAGSLSGVALVHQHGALDEQAGVALDDEVDRAVEQRMPGAAELGERPAVDGDQLLVEGDALVAP